MNWNLVFEAKVEPQNAVLFSSPKESPTKVDYEIVTQLVDSSIWSHPHNKLVFKFEDFHWSELELSF